MIDALGGHTLGSTLPAHYEVKCSIEVLAAVKITVERAVAESDRRIENYSSLTAEDVKTMEVAEQKRYLASLYEVSFLLGFDLLKDICAAYLSHRIDLIAQQAPSVMEGAERIRKFLELENEWTEEEMQHLAAEMQLAEQRDPMVLY